MQSSHISRSDPPALAATPPHGPTLDAPTTGEENGCASAERNSMNPRPDVSATRGFSRSGLLIALYRSVPVFLLGVIPLISVVMALTMYSHADSIALDFHHELYPETELVLHGHNPYPPVDADLSDGSNNIWPIAAVIPVAPLVLLPPAVADWTMTILVLASLAGALWVIGVRDWRVYGITLLWPPVVSAYQTANATLPLCLLCALAWRYRDRRWIPGLAIGAALAVKFFLWPLVLWLAAVKQWRSSLLSVAMAAASLLLLLPFTPIGAYFALLRNLSNTFDDKSYTIFALLLDAGAPSPFARAVTLALGGALLALCWRRRSFALAIGAALVLSPIVWLHFFALLIVPLAIARPRFSSAWLLALPLWLVPGSANGDPWQTALGLVVLLTILLVCVRREAPASGRSHVVAR
ncbi:MAG: DUF2029 domain-containing protein [Thermoleophilia bacterium]|nr:DUF2029 domain-containing protein [Thermoleophilia bacterium]